MFHCPGINVTVTAHDYHMAALNNEKPE